MSQGKLGGSSTGGGQGGSSDLMHFLFGDMFSGGSMGGQGQGGPISPMSTPNQAISGPSGATSGGPMGQQPMPSMDFGMPQDMFGMIDSMSSKMNNIIQQPTSSPTNNVTYQPTSQPAPFMQQTQQPMQQPMYGQPTHPGLQQQQFVGQQYPGQRNPSQRPQLMSSPRAVAPQSRTLAGNGMNLFANKVSGMIGSGVNKALGGNRFVSPEQQTPLDQAQQDAQDLENGYSQQPDNYGIDSYSNDYSYNNYDSTAFDPYGNYGNEFTGGQDYGGWYDTTPIDSTGGGFDWSAFSTPDYSFDTSSFDFGNSFDFGDSFDFGGGFDFGW